MASKTALILTGPTAVGKTELSLELAERLNAEIISADSRQIYRELSIGSAKPSKAELQRAKHHLIDELDLSEPYSAGKFARRVRELLPGLQERERIPLITGGSTLYLHAVVEGLAEVPPIDASVREFIQKRLEREGAETLYAELQTVDPGAAATLDHTKTQRLIRALEVYHGSGTPLSHFYGGEESPIPGCVMIVLERSRDILHQRINSRVDKMLEAGLIGEVESILASGLSPGIYPLRTIGYRESIAYLNGEVSFGEMVRLIKRNTRRYAKRQMTWFRRYPGAGWINLDDHQSVNDSVDAVIQLYDSLVKQSI